MLADAADFPQRRGKVVGIDILADLSASMAHEARDCEGLSLAKCDGVDRGLKDLLSYIKSRPDLVLDARLSIGTFSGNGVTSASFLPVREVELPEAKPIGGTPMCEALRRAATECVEFLHELNEEGTSYSAVTICVISDGAPTDGDGHNEVRHLLELAEDGSVNLVGIGISSDDEDRLKAMGFPTTLCVERARWSDVIRTGTLKARGGHPTLSADLA